MKGLILLGGTGSRLWPITKSVNKALLPLYSKPSCYYSISILMLAKIREIAIITTPNDVKSFKNLFGDGSKWGCDFSYLIQENPEGIAQAFHLGQEFCGQEPSCLVLGDNFFYGHHFQDVLLAAKDHTEATEEACIFGYKVPDPERYGVVLINEDGAAIDLEEKPIVPKSPYAVPGIYFFPSGVCDEAKKLLPSRRGEYEITDLNRVYMDNKKMRCKIMGRGISWFDTGTPDSLMEASSFVQAIEKRQNVLVCSPEEIAYRNGWITRKEVSILAKELKQNMYANLLDQIE